MEHPCHGCNTPVEEGVAFCPNCNAPQIRVAVPEPEPPPQILPPLVTGDSRSPAEAGLPGGAAQAPAGRSLPTPGGPIEWSQAIPGAALAGALLAFCLLIPFSAFFLWMLASGALAVALYLRRVPNRAMSAGMGARLGALSGLFGFGIFAFLSSLELLLARDNGKVRELLQQVLQQSLARNSDPAVQASLQRLMTPEGLALLFTLGMVLFLAAFVLFSSVGGALGAYLFRNRNSR